MAAVKIFSQSRQKSSFFMKNHEMTAEIFEMSPCVWSQRFLTIVCITGFRIRSAYIGFQVETEVLIFEVIKRDFDPRKFVKWKCPHGDSPKLLIHF